jgi:hypothetical protein
MGSRGNYRLGDHLLKILGKDQIPWPAGSSDPNSKKQQQNIQGNLHPPKQNKASQ